MAHLQVELIRYVYSPQGPQADLHLIEPNDDRHEVRCLCKRDGTTEIGESAASPFLNYLNQRYGEQVVCGLCRTITLGEA